MKSANKSLSLLSSIPPPQLPRLSQRLDSFDEQGLIDIAVDDAHLPVDGKQQLRQILESHSQVCALRPGRTDVLQHCLYITHPVPIKQQPYRMSPSKQAVFERTARADVKGRYRETISLGLVIPCYSSTKKRW